MAELFGRDRSVIARHIRNAFQDGELDQTAACAKIAQTAADGLGKKCFAFTRLDAGEIAGLKGGI